MHSASATARNHNTANVVGYQIRAKNNSAIAIGQKCGRDSAVIQSELAYYSFGFDYWLTVENLEQKNWAEMVLFSNLFRRELIIVFTVYQVDTIHVI